MTAPSPPATRTSSLPSGFNSIRSEPGSTLSGRLTSAHSLILSSPRSADVDDGVVVLDRFVGGDRLRLDVDRFGIFLRPLLTLGRLGAGQAPEQAGATGQAEEKGQRRGGFRCRGHGRWSFGGRDG